MTEGSGMIPLDKAEALFAGKWIALEYDDGFKPLRIVTIVGTCNDWGVLIAYSTSDGEFDIVEIDSTSRTFFDTQEAAQAEADKLNAVEAEG